MQPRLLVKLPEGWQDVSEQMPDGGATFVRGGRDATAALQVSFGLNPEGTGDLSEEELTHMAATIELGESFGTVVERSSGPSLFGKMGSAVYRGGKYPRVQVWFLSNGRDVIMASHIATEEPEDDELHETRRIVENLALVPEE
jgi:hypothetical protein